MAPPVGPTGKATLPTYRTVADVLEKKNGSGIRLAGWTVARAFLITPPFLAVGVEPKKAVLGGLLSSTMISLFTMMRIYTAGFEKEWAARLRRDNVRRLRTRRTRATSRPRSAARPVLIPAPAT